MKKLLLLLAITASLLAAQSFTNTVHAQVVKTLTPSAADDTLVNADTAFITVDMLNNATAVEGHVEKISGTVAGTIVLQGSIDGTNYDDISSLTLANVATNYKVYPLHPATGKLIYAKYRLRFITSGTCSVKPKGYLLRRSD
jgi:hypothetical protein